MRMENEEQASRPRRRRQGAELGQARLSQANVAGTSLSLLSSLGNEATLARRVEEERRARGWSQERLAKEVQGVGCHLPQSAVSKIENPSAGGRRAITVDEAIAFAKVFELSLFELVLTDAAYERVELQRTIAEASKLIQQERRLNFQLKQLVSRAMFQVRQSKDSREWFEGRLSEERERDAASPEAEFAQAVLDLLERNREEAKARFRQQVIDEKAWDKFTREDLLQYFTATELAAAKRGEL